MAIHPSGLLRTDGMPLHKQLAIVLKDEINAGGYAPGTIFPTEEVLCERFSVSRGTLRRALSDLEQQGFVYRRQGVGTFVRDQASNALPEANLSLLESLRKSQLETKAEVLHAGSEMPSPLMRKLLQIAPGESATRVLRLRRAGSTPVMIVDAWMPKRYSKGITEAALKKRPLYELLQAQGVEFGRVIMEISSEAADPYRASLLKTSVGSPLTRQSRLMHDRSDAPVQHLTVYLCPERSRIVMDATVDKNGTLSAGYIAHDPRLLGQQ